MEVKEMQKQVDAFIQKCGGYWEPLSMLARLTEETGEVARGVNVLYGEKMAKGDRDHKDKLEKELIDVIFTAVAMATSEGIDIEKAFCDKMGLDYDKCKGVYFKDEDEKMKGAYVKSFDKETIIKNCEKFMKENVPESRIGYSYLKHVTGCRDYALKLAEIYGGDRFIVEASALLHDIGADAGKTHPVEGAKRARKFLSQFNIPSEILERIIGCIENHSMGMCSDNLEEQIIRDADGLIFLEDTFKYFIKKMLAKTSSLEESKKLSLEKLNGMKEKIKTKEGIRLSEDLVSKALEYTDNFNLNMEDLE